MTEQNVPILTIDGPSGSGKGTIAAVVAEKLGWHYLDSGALYRLTALAADRKGISMEDEAALAQVAKELEVRFSDGKTYLAGEEVGKLIRSEAVGSGASKLAVFPLVREALLVCQRSFAQAPGLVTDGRDMGYEVFPEAQIKIFLTASAEERARRRYEQLRAVGSHASFEEIFDMIRLRDERDSNRAVSPLVPAENAHVIDATDLSIDEVLAEVMKLAETSLSK